MYLHNVRFFQQNCYLALAKSLLPTKDGMIIVKRVVTKRLNRVGLRREDGREVGERGIVFLPTFVLAFDENYSRTIQQHQRTVLLANLATIGNRCSQVFYSLVSSQQEDENDE